MDEFWNLTVCGRKLLQSLDELVWMLQYLTRRKGGEQAMQWVGAICHDVESLAEALLVKEVPMISSAIYTVLGRDLLSGTLAFPNQVAVQLVRTSSVVPL